MGREKTFEFLLTAGADMTIKDVAHRNAQEIAEHLWKKEIIMICDRLETIFNNSNHLRESDYDTLIITTQDPVPFHHCLLIGLEEDVFSLFSEVACNSFTSRSLFSLSNMFFIMEK